ncbi:MAG: hypothetical protein NZX77_09965, partial [Polyangiaceae bacterium]|nr:hypothetical protein [Polyangiaceae bacterium]
MPGAIQPYFALDLADPSATFFDQPWPSDLRVRTDGSPDLAKFPGRTTFFGRYVELAESTLRGASVSPTIYVRLTGPVTLPASGASPALRLLDVDPASPERGRSWPVIASMSREGSRHLPPWTLQVRVAPGFVLRPGTRYALVLLRTLTEPPLGTTPAFEATKGTVPRKSSQEEQARQALRPVHDELEAQGIGRENVAAVAAFRTQDPTHFTRALLTHAATLRGNQAPRVLRAWWDPSLSPPGDPAPYRVLRGLYCTPNYQQQTEQAPYLQGGGMILRDERGDPLLAPLTPADPAFRSECGPLLLARFVLSIPGTPPPPEGYPLVVSAHGTGGNALSFLGGDDFAGWAASRGIAVVSTDQPLHGAGGEAPRPGSTSRSLVLPVLPGLHLPLPLDPSMLFYNPLNPAASRDNLRQATVDAAVLLRLLAGQDLGATTGLQGADGTTVSLRFRPDRLLLAGH